MHGGSSLAEASMRPDFLPLGPLLSICGNREIRNEKQKSLLSECFTHTYTYTHMGDCRTAKPTHPADPPCLED